MFNYTENFLTFVQGQNIKPKAYAFGLADGYPSAEQQEGTGSRF